VSLLSIFGLVEVLVLSSLFPNLWFASGGARP
jgi:hypothetical protein